MNLRDRVFTMSAEARIAAKAEGWRPHPADRDLFVRNRRSIRLTQLDPRRWCWSDVKEPARG